MLFKTNELYGNKMSMASLYFQTFMYFDLIFTTILLPFQLFLFIFKYNSLYYTTTTMALEVILLVFAFFINLLRLHLGKSGNRGKLVLRIAFYLLLSIIIIVGFVYMIVWQSYIYWLEFILYLMAIVIVGL